MRNLRSRGTHRRYPRRRGAGADGGAVVGVMELFPGATAACALDLRKFAQTLEAQGELQRIAAAVDVHLEIAAITDRVCKSDGPALRFDQVKGYSVPVLTNLFGSEGRTAWALGAESLEVAAARMARALALAGPGRGVERLLRSLAAPSLLAPRVSGPVSGSGGNLALLPALQSWPGDGGRYLTLPLIFTRDPESGRVNCGMYRVQLLDGHRAAIHWRPTSDAARHHAAWTRRGEAMPVAIVLGGPPALIWAAGVPLPAAADEVALAALIAGAPLSMSDCQTSDLLVPTAFEAVLEGSV
ncbi:MAG: UbiD family decarboxylase, partial [Gemmatimonadales bacterium]